jgi:hypothetical protein
MLHGSAIVLLFALQAPAPTTHVIIVAGVGGEPAYQQAFFEAGAAMSDAATQQFGVPDANVTFLAEEPARDRARIDGKSTKAEVEKAFAAVASRSRTGDLVFVLLIGHGSAMNGSARFNVPGPDLTAADFAKLLDGLEGRRVAFINAASASGDFVAPLSGKDRAIVTATKSGMERNETTFAKFFVAAYAGGDADSDKDGRVSLLEAFEYARREVARRYEDAGTLRTEHALLDDDGDGKGIEAPTLRTGDGALASRLFLSAGSAGIASSDPRLAELTRRKAGLEASIDSLRRRKATTDSLTYEQAFERLLLELALVDRQLRDANPVKKP